MPLGLLCIVCVAADHLSGRSNYTEKDVQTDFGSRFQLLALLELHFGLMEVFCVRIIDKTLRNINRLVYVLANIVLVFKNHISV